MSVKKHFPKPTDRQTDSSIYFFAFQKHQQHINPSTTAPSNNINRPSILVRKSNKEVRKERCKYILYDYFICSLDKNVKYIAKTTSKSEEKLIPIFFFQIDLICFLFFRFVVSASPGNEKKIIMNTMFLRSLSRGAVQRSTVPSVANAAVSGISSSSSSFHSSSTTNQASGGVPQLHGTTILCVRKNGKVCMIGDGMVSMGNMIVKPNAVKIRRIQPKGSSDDPQKSTLVGFAGTTADAFTLLERLEGKLDEYPGQLSRSCVELAKGWRTDKYLRRLEASLIVADETVSLEITGNGDVLEMSDGVISVGSGSPYAIGTFICFFLLFDTVFFL